MLNIPINIYALRKKHNMSARQLGNLVGKSECTITAWERGEKNPSTKSLILLCNVFGCTLDEFFLRQGFLSRPAAGAFVYVCVGMQIGIRIVGFHCFS